MQGQEEELDRHDGRQQQQQQRSSSSRPTTRARARVSSCPDFHADADFTENLSDFDFDLRFCARFCFQKL